MYHDDVAGFPADYGPEKGALVVGVTQGSVRFWTKTAVAAQTGMALVSDTTLSDGVKWQLIPDAPPNDGKTYALTGVTNAGATTYTWIETTDCPTTPTPPGGGSGGVDGGTWA